MPLRNTDSYKLSHKAFMNEGTEYIYSNLTPRSSRLFPEIPGVKEPDVVFFGLQHFIKDFLINEFNERFFKKDISVVQEFKELTDAYLGKDSISSEHFEELHKLGYLPISIKALPEGTISKIKIPVLTITNTHPEFAWLTNYLETVLSAELWKPTTVASLVYNWRKMVNDYAIESTGSTAGTEFQLHDFSARGMSGRHDSALSGSAFLLSSHGTDTVPAMALIRDFYNTNLRDYFLATSVPASEHMIASLGTAVEGELESYRKWITEDYPSGIVSLVSDTYDYWKVLTEYLPILKEDILNRTPNELGLAKVVIRPDSGDPTEIITGKRAIPIDIENPCMENWIDVPDSVRELQRKMSHMFLTGELDNYTFEQGGWEVLLLRNKAGKYFLVNFTTPYNSTVQISNIREYEATSEIKGSIEVLWDVFGGEVNEKGYRVLHERIGLIYGDSMTPTRVNAIMERLLEKGYASTNAVFGVGSYSLQYLTRDSLGMAVKATYAEVNGKGYSLSKDPITDSGTKVSAKGLLAVKEGPDGLELLEEVSKEVEGTGLLREVFRDGELLVDEDFETIRNRLWSK